jgi:hypothetical protein
MGSPVPVAHTPGSVKITLPTCLAPEILLVCREPAGVELYWLAGTELLWCNSGQVEAAGDKMPP